MPGPDWLGSDEVILTVGVLRYGQLSCLQVGPLPMLTEDPSLDGCCGALHLLGKSLCFDEVVPSQEISCLF